MSHVDDVSIDHPLALPSGTMLKEYRIDAVLGQGGFGITYLAFDTLLDEKVAIKEYFPGDNAMRTRDLSARARTARGQEVFRAGLAAFLDEARIIARFRHTNVVQVRRFFEDRGTGYIVLNYEVGRSLEEMMAHAPLPEAGLLSIMQGILRGLETVHERAVLHRDLKPRNVIVREDGTAVLLDFGAARDFGLRNSFTVTQIASSGYSPPEQYGIGDQHGPWSDLYALGGIAYRGVTGRVPVDSLSRLRDDPLVPAAKAAAGRYSGSLLRAIDRMMQIDEAKRPVSVADVRKMLPALDRARPMPLASFPGRPVTEPLPHDWTRRSTRAVRRGGGSSIRKGAIAAVLAVALFGTAGAAYVLGHGNRFEPAAARGPASSGATVAEVPPPAPPPARPAGRPSSSPAAAPTDTPPAPHPASGAIAANAPTAGVPHDLPATVANGAGGAGGGGPAPRTAADPVPPERRAPPPAVDAPVSPGAGPGAVPTPPAVEAHDASGGDGRVVPGARPSEAAAASPPPEAAADGPDETPAGWSSFAQSHADDAHTAFEPDAIPFLSPADRMHVALEEARGGETALALSLNGKYGVSSGQDTSDEAQVQAMDRCVAAGGDDCQVYAIDDRIVWPGLVPTAMTSLLTGLTSSPLYPRPAAVRKRPLSTVHLHRRVVRPKIVRFSGCTSHCGPPVVRPRALHHFRPAPSPPRPMTLGDYIAAAFGLQNRNAIQPRSRR